METVLQVVKFYTIVNWEFFFKIKAEFHSDKGLQSETVQLTTV